MAEVFAGRFELVDVLGHGGMGDVWRVWICATGPTGRPRCCGSPTALGQWWAKTLGVQLLDALEAVNATGIVHRDVKPSKITNLVAAVEGADCAPDVLVQQLSARSLERDRLKGEIAKLTARQSIDAEEVQELIDYVGGLASALRDATDEEKADLYQELGLDLTYDPLAHQLHAELVPGGRPSGRVRGGT